MGMAAHFHSSHPSQLDLSGRRRLLFSSPLQGGRQAVDNFGCRRSCSHCISVYCLRVMLKINSQQQHQQKALTDCLMCWHSYKLLDKKSNTHPLFSSPYTPKLLQRRNMKRVWDRGCHPAGDHCCLWGLMASGLRRTCSPVLRANKVVSLCYNWSPWLFFFQEYFPLGQASGARVGSGVELFTHLLSSESCQ